MEISLSDTDMRKYIPNVIIYHQLAGMNFRSLLRMLPLVILYQTGENVGHWVLLHKTPEGIEFFDSYGAKPDTEFSYIPPRFQRPHHLTRLLTELAQNITINYNDYAFQSSKPRVATCGRHVIVRHLFSDYKIDEYKAGILAVSRMLNTDPDGLVVWLTT